MKQFIVKIITIPFIAYFAMMFTAAIMGTTMSHAEFQELTGGRGLTIWYAWLAILSVVAVLHHLYKVRKLADKDHDK